MNKCTFKYCFEYPTFKEINDYIFILNKKYSRQLKEINKSNQLLLLKFNYQKYIKLIQYHNTVINSLICDILDFFPQLSNDKCLAFIHGSFAKKMNRINSDIDLNILYLEKFKKENLVIEEIISIMIQNVIGYSGRDKIHTMMLYTCSNINYNNIESTEDCKIIFMNNESIHYKCRPNYDEVMYKIKHSSRLYNDFIKYISNNISSNTCNEWCYSFKQLNNFKGVNITTDIAQISELKVNKQKINLFIFVIDELINKIDSINNDINSCKNISDFNKIVKVYNLQYVYSTLAILNRFYFFQNNFLTSLDFYKLLNYDKLKNIFSKNEIDNIKKCIIMYHWQLSRIEEVFILLNYNFSSRNYDIFPFKELETNYKLIYNESFKTIYDMITVNLYVALKKILFKVKEEVLTWR